MSVSQLYKSNNFFNDCPDWRPCEGIREGGHRSLHRFRRRQCCLAVTACRVHASWQRLSNLTPVRFLRSLVVVSGWESSCMRHPAIATARSATRATSHAPTTTASSSRRFSLAKFRRLKPPLARVHRPQLLPLRGAQHGGVCGHLSSLLLWTKVVARSARLAAHAALAAHERGRLRVVLPRLELTRRRVQVEQVGRRPLAFPLESGHRGRLQKRAARPMRAMPHQTSVRRAKRVGVALQLHRPLHHRRQVTESQRMTRRNRPRLTALQLFVGAYLHIEAVAQSVARQPRRNPPRKGAILAARLPE